MKNNAVVKSPLLIGLLVLSGLYFLAGIIEAGKELNTIPWVGCFFWGLAALIFIYFFFIPLYEFFILPVQGELDNLNDRQLFKYAKWLTGKKAKNISEQLDKLRVYLKAPKSAKTHEDIRLIVKEIREKMQMTGRETIHKYMKIAAVAAVVSRKGWLDSVLLLILQIRMIKKISSDLGYRPSCTFLICCSIWCLCNSFAAAIIEDDVIEESITEIVAEFSGEKILGSVANNLLQAVHAGISVYSTGIVVQDYLMGDHKRKGVRELVKLRYEGLKEGRKLISDSFRF